MLLLPQEGKHEKMSKAPSTQHGADKSHQLLLCACHYCSASAQAHKCVFAVCEVLGPPEGALAGWQVRAMGSERATGIATDSADGLSLKKHSPLRSLTFSHSLLNTGQLQPLSICVFVSVCAFVLSAV